MGVAGAACKTETGVEVTRVRGSLVFYLSHIQINVVKIICRTLTLTLKKMGIKGKRYEIEKWTMS